MTKVSELKQRWTPDEEFQQSYAEADGDYRVVEAEVLDLAKVLTGLADPPEPVLAAVRARMPQPPTPGFPYAAEVNELVEVLRSGGSNQRQRLREIGQQVNAAGGFAAMQATAKELRRQFPQGEDGWHPWQVDAAWGLPPWY